MPGAKEDIPGATDGRGHYDPAQHEMKVYSFEGKDGHSLGKYLMKINGWLIVAYCSCSPFPYVSYPV
jgi:hypothetical protein